MGTEVSAASFSREQRQKYREKVRLNLDVFERMLQHAQVRRRPRDDRDGDRAQPRRQGLRAQARQRDGPRGDRERRLPDRARALQHRVQRGPDDAGGHDRPVARGRPARVAQRGRAQGQRGRRPHPHDRHPPDGHARALRGRLDERQHALPGPQRRRARRPRRGHLPRHRGLVGGEARPVCGLARPRVGLHLDAAAPAGRPVQLRELLERRAGAGRAAARRRSQQPVLLRPAAVARDADRAVQPGRRHPGGRAEEPGRSATRLLRRAVGDLDLRPVRGERPLLPGAAAGAVRRGPPGGPRGRGRAGAGRAEAAQRDRLPVEPAHLRHARQPPAPAGREPRPPGRPEHHRRHGQRGLLLRGAADADPGGPAGLDADVVRRRRGQLLQRRRATGSSPGSTGRVAGRSRSTELVLRHLLPLAHEGLTPVGRGAGGARPLPVGHRGPLPQRPQRRVVADRDDASASRSGV